ncbi:MAG TPA: hypothetical protein VIA62_24315 [Thermoanaerobaculia bacterium]|jgi:hypothetical protein|nr:hypothetical protein [Thermoanaerobaculia bacterium]
MLKKKLWIISTSLSAFLLLAPTASQAQPGSSPLSRLVVAAGSFDPLAQVWDLLTGRARGHAPARRAVKPKNGCGIDPQGQPLCISGNPGGPGGQSTTPPPDDGSGN